MKRLKLFIFTFATFLLFTIFTQKVIAVGCTLAPDNPPVTVGQWEPIKLTSVPLTQNVTYDVLVSPLEGQSPCNLNPSNGRVNTGASGDEVFNIICTGIGAYRITAKNGSDVCQITPVFIEPSNCTLTQSGTIYINQPGTVVLDNAVPGKQYNINTTDPNCNVTGNVTPGPGGNANITVECSTIGSHPISADGPNLCNGTFVTSGTGSCEINIYGTIIKDTWKKVYLSGAVPFETYNLSSGSCQVEPSNVPTTDGGVNGDDIQIRCSSVGNGQSISANQNGGSDKCTKLFNVADKPPGPTITPRPTISALCGDGINSAIGCIPLQSTTALTAFFLSWGFGIGGGIALLLIIYGGFITSTSAGNPQKIELGKNIVTAAVAGLILMIFSVFILELVGVRILNLPEFGS